MAPIQKPTEEQAAAARAQATSGFIFLLEKNNVSKEVQDHLFRIVVCKGQAQRQAS